MGSRMTTIHDFPIELLIEIFQMVQGRGAQPRPSTSFSCYRARLHSSILLSLVCKSWREVTLGCGTLWSSIPVDTSHVNCLESGSTMIKRSNGAELELSVHIGTDAGTPDRTRGFTDALVANNSRIRSLYINSNSCHAVVNGVRPLEATDNIIAAINFILTIPYPTSQRTSNLLRGLRALSLSLPPSNVAVNISGLLEIIRASTELEFLHFVSLHSICEGCPSTHAIHIPKLRRLSLRACDSATILSHITTPRASTIDVVMPNSPKVRRQLGGSHILTALPRSLTDIRIPEGTVKLILIEDETRGEFRLGLAPLHSKMVPLVVTNGHRPLERFILRSLGAIAADPYFGAIQSFTLSCTSCVHIPWSTVLNRFTLLSELNALSRHAMDIIHALLGTGLDGSPLCSSLRRIRFYTGPNGKDHYLDPPVFSTFHRFRLEYHCSVVRITRRRADGRSEEL